MLIRGDPAAAVNGASAIGHLDVGGVALRSQVRMGVVVEERRSPE